MLNITAPPCPHCRYWKPQRKYMMLDTIGTIFDGVRLCQAADQYHDFSCFRPNAAGEVRRNAVTSTGLLADESKGET